MIIFHKLGALGDTEHHIKKQNITHSPETTLTILSNFLPRETIILIPDSTD